MSSRQAQACMRLSTLGLKQSIVHDIIDRVNSWSLTNGEEWTVERLKAFKQLFLTQMGGIKSPLSHWIATHPDGTPKGAFRPLFRCTSHKARAKALNALMVYTSFLKQGNPSTKQWKKFQSAVEGSSTPSSFRVHPDIRPEFGLGHGMDIFAFPWSSNRRAPGYANAKTVPETDFPSQWFGFFHSWTNLKLIREFPELYDRALAGNLYRDPPHTSNPFEADGVGRVSFLQEPGYKLRAIANPHRFHQLALEPLKVGLLDYLKHQVAEDCTHNQDAGTEWVLNHLRSGTVVHCLDLSSATDRFPAEVTFELLRRNPNPDVLPYVNLFERLSRSSWFVRDPEKGQRQIRWEVGQPLGLGPSFPAFALSHHAVVQSLQHQHGGDYRIIGDDIAITGDSLAYAYRQTMESLGVEISSSKSISSSQVAEFAGKVVTPEGAMPTVKWREISDRNFLDYTRFFGRQFIGALRPRQKRVARALSEVPEAYGGLGFNPKGKKWEDRVDENWMLISELLREKDSLIQASDTSLKAEDIRLTGIIHPEDRDVMMGVHPTGSTLSRVVAATGVRKGTFPSDDNPLTPVERQGGDPRGQATLDKFEALLDSQEPRTRAAKEYLRGLGLVDEDSDPSESRGPTLG